MGDWFAGDADANMGGMGLPGAGVGGKKRMRGKSGLGYGLGEEVGGEVDPVSTATFGIWALGLADLAECYGLGSFHYKGDEYKVGEVVS